MVSDEELRFDLGDQKSEEVKNEGVRDLFYGVIGLS